MKTIFSTYEKKTKNVPVKKSDREKAQNWVKKGAWKQISARDKNQKSAKNGFYGKKTPV